ncbi:MAG: phosphoesterase domain-containing protein [Marinobacter sp. T13-3]|nr:MAG: phosphoesterase domain-containing protein [Marinobacter sp. T13-3]
MTNTIAEPKTMQTEAPAMATSNTASTLDALKQKIMATRGAEYPEQYSPKNLINPGKLKDGERAALRIAAALIRRQRITLVADFDCDGATGAAIMKRGLLMIADALTAKQATPNGTESAHIDVVIPDRFNYGYGLKPELATEVIHPLNPDLIITIDNGIASHEAADLIATWGKPDEDKGAPDLIITDHHLPGDTLPQAYAVVNPTQTDCQFDSKALCGAGVAFHIVLLVRRAIVQLLGQTSNGKAAASRMRGVALNTLTDLVALGTIGDMVPMDANNRLLTKIGLDRINKGYQMPARAAHEKGYLSYGLRALLEVANVTAPVTATDLAFQVVPRINSVGRLTKPLAGVNCLLADNPETAATLAGECDTLNTERKQVQATMEAEARADLDKMMADGDALADTSSTDPQAALIFHNDTWHTGLVGLIASRIKERTGGAVVCFAPEKAPDEEVEAARREQANQAEWRDSDLPEQVDPSDADINWLKGSGRSDNVHLRDALAYIASRDPDILMQFGGHARAAGLTLYRPHLPKFRRLFAEAVDHLLSTAPLDNQTFDDGPLPAVHRSFPLAHWIERQPWGQQFPEPQFTQAFQVKQVNVLKEAHQRLVVTDADGQGEPFPLMWFRSVDERTPPLKEGQTVTLGYRLTVNRFRGNNTLQGIVTERKG